MTREVAKDAADAARFRPPSRRTSMAPPSRRTFVAMLGAAAAAVMLRDRVSGREVIRNPATGKPIWIGHA